MTPRVMRCVALALALALSAPPLTWALDVGDPMPPISVKKWVSNTPVTAASAKGKVVVVEFWATWCPPCRQSIPHLNKLHETYEKKGVVICGITQEQESTVTDFIKTMPMKYHVGIDTGSTGSVYMKGVSGIPHAFVIDRRGKVAWQGHPMAGLDDVLAKLAAEGGGAASDDPLEAALELSTGADLSQRDLPKALALARKAYEASGRKDAKALGILARVHYEMGHLPTAVEAALAAAKLATGEEEAALKAAADFYKKELERRREDPAAKF